MHIYINNIPRSLLFWAVNISDIGGLRFRVTGLGPGKTTQDAAKGGILARAPRAQMIEARRRTGSVLRSEGGGGGGTVLPVRSNRAASPARYYAEGPLAHGVGRRREVDDGALHLRHHVYAVGDPL